MEKETILVTDQNGVEREAEVILCFEKDNKNFIIYTFNETDESGMIILYSSMIRVENGVNVFEKITPEDWTMVKNVMNSIVKEGKE